MRFSYKKYFLLKQTNKQTLSEKYKGDCTKLIVNHCGWICKVPEIAAFGGCQSDMRCICCCPY